MFRPGRTQRETLLTVLRLAAGYEQWLTLAELAEKTRFPPASLSAQLRHLRKPKYGAWEVEKRRREWEKEEVVWEYGLAEGREKGSI
jgi:DNA-binding IclR family transcriptional regulator